MTSSLAVLLPSGAWMPLAVERVQSFADGACVRVKLRFWNWGSRPYPNVMFTGSMLLLDGNFVLATIREQFQPVGNDLVVYLDLQLRVVIQLLPET